MASKLAFKHPSKLVAMVGPSDTQRKSLGLGGYTGPRQRHPDDALPRTFSASLGIKTLRNDETFYRNNGNKHIESKGDK